ncbi:MAG: DMT family transporter [Gammaproteobacteria bacterium]|nr:DMT family transporter [Gammaproteobacteria bacterium]
MTPGVLAAALAAVIIFGGSAVGTKLAVSGFQPVDVALLRTVIGGLLAIILALLLRIRPPTDPARLGLLLLSGLCGFIAFPLLFTLGVERTTANHATMVLAILPVLTGALAMAWDRQRPAAKWWGGCAIAFTGEVLLIYEPAGQVDEATLAGDLLVLLSTLFASLGYVAGGRLQRGGYSSRGTTFWGVGLFALLLLPVLPFFISTGELQAAGTEAWSGLLYQAIGVTIVAYLLWYWALGTGGIARVGLMQFLQPVSGVILAWLVLAETLSLKFTLASVIILLGVLIAFRAK